jgi:hypothetical protein
MRSPSAPPPYSSGKRGQQGFVEAEEVTDDPQAQQRGSRADMVNMLAQQAMSMGLVGGKDGRKGDFLNSLVGK